MRNNPSAKHWNVEDGYQSHVNKSEEHPYRVIESRSISSMLIRPSITVDNSSRLCTFALYGFIISLRLPDEGVDIHKSLFFIPANQFTYVLIKPKVTAISEGLRSYAPEVRGCFFRSERQLRFYKSYSQQKCELECLSNITKKECDCVPFYIPSN